jgi:hypothetical protein
MPRELHCAADTWRSLCDSRERPAHGSATWWDTQTAQSETPNCAKAGRRFESCPIHWVTHVAS